ncbi:MAG: hypothetical protein IDH49_11700 [Gammaproteobacteria bacterium]|nr:hypothetical protein [Gammaproteobacteria bacterium]
MSATFSPLSWSLVCYAGDEQNGAVPVIRHDGATGSTVVKTLRVQTENTPDPRCIFLNTAHDDRVVLLDPVSKEIRSQDAFPIDARPDHMYRDAEQAQLWLGNDGDKITGADPLNCGEQGSSVTVIQMDSQGTPVKVLKTLCVGRGHHVTTFTFPSPAAPAVPRRAFISNLMDGTISVVGNDPADAASYLKVIAIINLCEPAREKDGTSGVPNNAAPHGMVYSPLTGKVYNMNNGYGTIAVIDPLTHAVEDSIYVGTSTNALLSPDGRFIVCKGADRKSDESHVIGKITVLDVVTKAVSETTDLIDVYPSVYRFSADGKKLYLTTASTGNKMQKANLKMNTLLVFDSAALPTLRLSKEVTVGMADCGRRPIAFLEQNGVFTRTFVSNPTDGTVSVLDGDERVLETVTVSAQPVPALHFYSDEGRLLGA